jgi:hypothetical protein
MTPFDHWWNTEGIRFLGPENKIPSIQERCRAAYIAGMADQKEDWDLPEGCHFAAIEMIQEEEVE